MRESDLFFFCSDFLEEILVEKKIGGGEIWTLNLLSLNRCINPQDHGVLPPVTTSWILLYTGLVFFSKQSDLERKKADVRKRMEEQSMAKKKKGFMTPERKKKLRVKHHWFH